MMISSFGRGLFGTQGKIQVNVNDAHPESPAKGTGWVAAT
jgi:hypothetical protein